MGTTIAVSESAYKIVIERKQEMEKEQEKIVTMGDALDVILGEKGGRKRKKWNLKTM